ncbi:MAG: sigW 5 [Bacteroidetes bacterium]|nr:sigW 5 [Bacteroidota bacterium]
MYQTNYNTMKTLEFEKLILNFKDSLEYFAISLTANREDAKDLVQDTILKALVNKDRYQEETNIKAWLFTILKNTFINNYRRKQRVNTLIDSNLDLSALGNIFTNEYRRTDEDVNVKDINFAINSINPEQRIPFEMVNSGYKYQEIADTYSLSIGTVKSRIFLARKKLMEIVGD